ncbi:hypothetical protein B9Z65_443 [Elsinoe australis]|uniref:Uncharacterized protein n=1 Tax=Elsinoe australis TaxID=40998 RepID=A0A2P8AIJ5_9PEZI|nr:hypothetical protein B9Z65_443 [Elsinoe australis]
MRNLDRLSNAGTAMRERSAWNRPKRSRTVCVESAQEIARILLVVEQDPGFRRITVETSQMLPSAALVLIFSTLSVSSDKVKDDILRDLTTIMRALDELSSVLDSARESRDYLLSIQQQWQKKYKKSKKRSRDAGMGDLELE